MISHDAPYVIWCINNLIHFCVENNVLIVDSIDKNELFFNAVDNNLIKHSLIGRYSEDDYDEYESPSYSWEESYHDGGGGDEWSNPTEFWG